MSERTKYRKFIKELHANEKHVMTDSNNMSWAIKLANKPSRSLVNPLPVEEVRQYAFENHNREFENNGQGKLHLQTMRFILSAWPEIAELINPTRADYYQDPVFCFPEVIVPDPRNHNGLCVVDCLASDRNGLLYVVEIGTRRKKPQLEREISALLNQFPHYRFVGLLAYYELQKRHQSGKLRLALV
jgi:hypothetical protein